MRIGWLSASPQATTGYGTQTRMVCSRLLERHEVVCIATVGDVVIWGGRQEVETPNGPLTVLALTDPRSAPILLNEYYGPEHKLQVVVGFMDAFGIEWINDSKIPVVGWIPIDGPFTPHWRHLCRNYHTILAYSKFGYGELLKWFPYPRVGYIPHGISTEIYRSLNRDEEREVYSKNYGIPPDGFLAVSVGANVGPRKCLPLLMKTFAGFVKTHPDAYLFIHTNAYQQWPKGYDLIQYRGMLGMTKHIHFPTYSPIVSPTTEEEMARLYSAADIYVQNATAEGFGLPIAEAMSCGRPVIAPTNSAQTELVKGHGWPVKTVDEEIYIDLPPYVPVLTEYPVPDQRSLLEQLDRAYRMPDEREALGKAARRHIVQNHSWEVVMPRWFKFLQHLEDELELLKAMAEGLGVEGASGA